MLGGGPFTNLLIKSEVWSVAATAAWNTQGQNIDYVAFIPNGSCHMHRLINCNINIFSVTVLTLAD